MGLEKPMTPNAKPTFATSQHIGVEKLASRHCPGGEDTVHPGFGVYFFSRSFAPQSIHECLREMFFPRYFRSSEPRDPNPPILPRKLVSRFPFCLPCHFLLQVRSRNGKQKIPGKKVDVAILQFVPKKRIKPRVQKDESNKNTCQPWESAWTFQSGGFCFLLKKRRGVLKSISLALRYHDS